MVLSFETTTSQPVNLSLTVENLFLLSFHSEISTCCHKTGFPTFTSEGLWVSPPHSLFPAGPGPFSAGTEPEALSVPSQPLALPLPGVPSGLRTHVALESPAGQPNPRAVSHELWKYTERLGLQTHVCRRLPQFHVLNWIDKLMWSRNGLLVCVLQELHILFVPLLHALQYHLALVSLQLQSLDLNDDTINFKDKKKIQ